MPHDFKLDALDFVIKNNCANSTPVELIEQVMRIGYLQGLSDALSIIKPVSKAITKSRIDSIPHDYISKTIMI